MDKHSFYKEQAEKFWDFAEKNPKRDLLSLFEDWCESRYFSDEDRQVIFAKFLSRLASKFLYMNYGR